MSFPLDPRAPAPPRDAVLNQHGEPYPTSLHPSEPHFPDEHVAVSDHIDRINWLARANFEGRQYEERHRRMAQRKPVIGEEWTCEKDLPSQGTDAQVRAWLYAAVGPPIVAVVQVVDGSVHFRYVGMTPFDPVQRHALPRPHEGGVDSGWAPTSAILRVSLDYFTEHFTRIP